MDLLKRFEENIKKGDLFSIKDCLLLAVSGGLDSVVLCELCKQAGYNFTIAHCNFKLRGEESDRDEQFVKELGKKYGVEVLVNPFETEKFAAEKKLSTQEAARELRYNWFAELLHRETGKNLQTTKSSSDPRPLTPDFLLTAHHADDNIETLLMNFFRGTGLHGLTGIPAINENIRRPLLAFTKAELLEFAKEKKLDWVEDSSNQSSKYTRNFFRNELIPAISKVFPQVNENLKDNIDRFREIEKLYKFSVGELKKKLCKQKGNEIHIPVLQLMKFNNRALIYEIISPFGFTENQVDELLKLAKSESGKYLQSTSNNYRIIKHRHWFIIAPVEGLNASNIIIEAEIRNLEFGIGQLKLELVPNTQFQIPNTSTIGIFDLKEIVFPLLLRKWKTGDYFYPLGMKKKKKLSRFFIDLKLSKTEKEKIWVIESNSRIAWVVGYRIDERFKITEKTETVLKMQLH